MAKMSIKKFIPRKIKNYLKYFFSRDNSFSSLNDDKKVFVFLGADYGNLGDVAITLSQITFLKEMFLGYDVIEVPISKTYISLKSIETKVTPDDIITIVGGGNTSERYLDIEECRQFVISKFPHNNIILFPQSVELENASKLFKKRFRKVYSSHKNILFLTRDKYSFESIRKYVPEMHVELMPDIVLSMKVKNDVFRRESITIAFRHDKERMLSDNQQNDIISLLNEMGNVEIFDTQLKSNITISQTNRVDYLNRLIEQFKKSKLVVTDRLHGMILSYITNTPCIVFSGDNTKIKGCYEWISDSVITAYLEEYNIEVLQEIANNFISAIGVENRKVSFKKMRELIETWVSDDNSTY